MEFNSTPFRIIWVTPKFPLGIPDGARHATCSLIRNLTQLHVEIHLLCLVPYGQPTDTTAAKQQLGVLSCSIIRRGRSKMIPLPSLSSPFTFRTFAVPAVGEAFKKELTFLLNSAKAPHKTFFVFDGLHTFAALSESDLQKFSSKCQGIIYRAHNYETALWEQCEERARTPWFRWFFRSQAALVRQVEKRVTQSVQVIAPVSEDDAAAFRRLAPEAVISVTPIGMDFPDVTTVQPVRDSATLEILFIGRLDWFPNRKGLMWFLENIWPRLVVKRQRVSLKIAGVGDGRWLQRFRNLARVDILGKVDDIQPLYESCALSIAPLFQGSGTRVKIIESARYARAVVSTSLGAQGTGLIPGSSYFRAETREEWFALLQTVTNTDCQIVGMKAFRSMRERFDGKTIAADFERTLDAVSAKTYAI